MLYNFPDPDTATNWKVLLDQDRLRTLKDIVKQSGISLNKYLPDDTMRICEGILAESGGLSPSQSVEQMANPYLPQYDTLRQKLHTYISGQRGPKLSLLKSHTGGLQSVRDIIQAMGMDMDELDTQEPNLEERSDSDPNPDTDGE